jgi:hypothetical protein
MTTCKMTLDITTLVVYAIDISISHNVQFYLVLEILNIKEGAESCGNTFISLL